MVLRPQDGTTNLEGISAASISGGGRPEQQQQQHGVG